MLSCTYIDCWFLFIFMFFFLRVLHIHVVMCTVLLCYPLVINKLLFWLHMKYHEHQIYISQLFKGNMTLVYDIIYHPLILDSTSYIIIIHIFI